MPILWLFVVKLRRSFDMIGTQWATMAWISSVQIICFIARLLTRGHLFQIKYHILRSVTIWYHTNVSTESQWLCLIFSIYGLSNTILLRQISCRYIHRISQIENDVIKSTRENWLESLFPQRCARIKFSLIRVEEWTLTVKKECSSFFFATLCYN